MPTTLGKQIQPIQTINVLGAIPPSSGGSGEEVTDNFNRTNGSLIVAPGKYCSDGVNEWGHLTGGALQLVSNQVSTSFTTAAGAYVSTLTPSADMTVQFKVTQISYSNYRLYLLGRVSSDFQTGYMAFIYQNDILVYKLVGGATSKISSSKPYVQVNDVVKLVLAGTSIKVYRNATLVHDLTDSTNTAAGYAGLWMNANVYRVDDFYALCE